jgi:hypothetical protein
MLPHPAARDDAAAGEGGSPGQVRFYFSRLREKAARGAG